MIITEKGTIVCSKGRFLLISFIAWLTTGCYHPDIQQGNMYSSAHVEQLKIGMSKNEVFAIMGQPVLDNPLTENQLTYVYYHYPEQGKTDLQHITLQFDQNGLKRIASNGHSISK